MDRFVGYILFVFGLLLMLFAFLLGYSIYTNIANNNLGPAQVSGNSINDTVRSGLQNVNNTLYSSTYTIIEVLVLFLFASIGYKVAYLGMQAVNSANEYIEYVEEKNTKTKKS